MRGWLLLTAVAALGLACGDPRVEVRFTAPAGWGSEIDKLQLDVLLPPVGSDGFDCDALAFGEVDDAVITSALAQVTDPTAPGDRIELEALPRVAPKLFRARAVDASGAAILAGCGALGEIDGDVVVDVAGEPTTTVAVVEPGLGQPLPDELLVTVTDAHGDPVVGGAVRTTIASSAPAIEGTAVTNDMGRARFTPTAPDALGPVLLDVRVRWEAAHRAPIASFQPPRGIGTFSLTGITPTNGRATNPDAIVQIGPFGAAGEPGVAILGPTDEGLTSRKAFLFFAGPPPTGVRVVETESLGAVFALGQIRRTAERTQLVALSAIRWQEIGSDGAITERATPAPARVVTKIVPAGPCDGLRESTIAVGFQDGTRAAYSADAAAVASPLLDALPEGRLVASGCVTVAPGPVRRTLVASESGLLQRLAVDADDGPRSGRWDAAAIGIGIRESADGSTGELLGSRLGIDGLSLTGASLVPLGNDRIDVMTTTSDDAPTLALSTAAGDIDGDGLSDLVALLDFGTDDDGKTEARLYVALGATYRGERIRGIGLPVSLPTPRLYLTDLDGNGVDEIAIVSAASATLLSLRTTP